ncbi:MAG: N-acetylglucosamine kinase, partial [Fimbriiglobus sp.]
VALAGSVAVVNDAALLLAAGTPDGWGLAVVGGTGSIAFVRTPDGRDGRCGGWGYLLGDEGSGYRLVVAGLRAACRAYDRCGPPTALVAKFLARMRLTDAPGFIDAIYQGAWDRAALSAMAPVVLEAAAAGDAVAADIVRTEAGELAKTAASAVRNLGLPTTDVPVALTGGVILESEPYRAAVLAGLRAAGIVPGAVQLVDDPVLGAVVLARRLAAR